MQRSARLTAILEQLANGGSISVGELADMLQVSPGTIRRDLAMLAQQRLLGRTHGGAVARSVSYELPLRYKGVRFAEEKQRIARAAASRVAEGMAIGLTGGTTATAVAGAVADRPGLTVVTNALNIASELAIRPNLRLLVTGGLVRSNSYEMSGPAAEATLAPLNLDIAFIGVDGIEARAGCTTYEAVEAHKASPYDLILMDCQMPTMDGFQASREIRLLEHTQPIIIAVTANALVGERERCLNAGMDDYLSKPFQAEQLVGIVKKWVAVRRQA